jgi:hypothetical protein
LDHFGEPDGEFDAFTQLLGSGAGFGWRGACAEFFHTQEEGIEVLLKHLLPKGAIAPRALKVGIGDRRKNTH